MLVFGDIPVGTKGRVYSLGRNECNELETGIIADVVGGYELKLRGSELLLQFAGSVDVEWGPDGNFYRVRGLE